MKQEAMAQDVLKGRARNGAVTKEKIFSEALQLFARKGVEGTSVRDISLAVGVADAALYRHFRSKDAIAQEIFSRHYGALARSVEEIGTQAQPFAATVRQLVSHFCTLFDEQPSVFAFILLNQHDHLRLIGDQENVVEALKQIMARAVERGEIAIRDPDLAAALALGATIQPAVYKLYGRLAGSMSTLAPQIAQAVCRALGTPEIAP
jgi:AcrR family transcriptional regulator